MKEKIWYEMVDKKFGEIYLTKYLGLQYTLKRTFKILTLAVSLSGILSWKYFEGYVWIAFALIALIQILLLVENQIIRSDSEIAQIADLKSRYTTYFQKLEELWTKFYDKEIKKEKASSKFFDLRKNDWFEIEQVDNKLNVKKYRRLCRLAEEETNEYINKYHNYGKEI